MNEGIVAQVAAWSDNELNDEDLIAAVEAAAPALEEHRAGFQQVVADLTPEQSQHCADLIGFCNQMFENIANASEELVTSVRGEDRNQAFIAGDTIARASFQLNQAFAEFRNQSLLALGPTEIPNFNLLLARKADYLEEPTEPHRLLLSEAIDSERVVTYHALEDLAKEERLAEVDSLINAFRDHMACLNDLAESVAENSSASFDAIFAELGRTFTDLQRLVPMVQMKLRGTGETDFPDINHLLKLMDDVAQGNIGDAPLMDALESIDESFSETKDQLEEVEGKLESALANDEIEAISETFEELEDGVEAAFKFFEERDRAWLKEAKGCFLEFAGRLSAHQKKLQEIEDNQGKLLCPKCGHSNEATRSRCANCGFPLPQNVAATATTTFESKDVAGPEAFVTANLEKLYTAVNGIAAGQLTEDAFLDALHQFEQVVEANIGSLPAEPEMPQAAQQHEVSKVYDAFEDGVEALRTGIETMRAYLDSQDEEVLAKGVGLVDEGARKLAAAGEAAGR